MMNINDVYKSGGDFLTAKDLDGKTIKLQIGDVGTHTFNEGQPDAKTQIVLHFNGTDKRLGLNVTNAKSIAEQLGDDTDRWPGNSIKLYPTKTDFAGNMVDCIRVVEEMPPEADGDDIPF
jgi:hypothetical protein